MRDDRLDGEQDGEQVVGDERLVAELELELVQVVEDKSGDSEGRMVGLVERRLVKEPVRLLGKQDMVVLLVMVEKAPVRVQELELERVRALVRGLALMVQSLSKYLKSNSSRLLGLIVQDLRWPNSKSPNRLQQQMKIHSRRQAPTERIFS